MATTKASKPIRYYLRERTFIDPRDPQNASKKRKAFQAYPAMRGRISFRDFCSRASRGTTFTQQELEAAVNYMTELARELVANGDIVEFGDLGTLMPTFRSKSAAKAEEFSVALHIARPTVRLIPKLNYFDLRTYPGISFQRVEAPSLKALSKKKKPTAKPTKPKSEGGASQGSGEEGGHLGI